MSVVSRRRFIVAVTGAALITGCGAAQVAAPPTSAPASTAAGVAQPQPTVGAALAPAMTAAAPLAAGQGEVVDVSGQAVAIYKDPQGKVTLLSPTCPHKGCQVGWNATAKTWDCPCHGSRYNADGSLLNGPATRGLTVLS